MHYAKLFYFNSFNYILTTKKSVLTIYFYSQHYYY